MDARSAYSIYVHKKAQSVQSEMKKTVHCLKLKKSYIGKKLLFPLVVTSRDYYREGIRYVAKVYVVKIYVFKVCCVLTFSKQSTYGSKVVTFANLLI